MTRTSRLEISAEQNRYKDLLSTGRELHIFFNKEGIGVYPKGEEPEDLYNKPYYVIQQKYPLSRNHPAYKITEAPITVHMVGGTSGISVTTRSNRASLETVKQRISKLLSIDIA